MLCSVALLNLCWGESAQILTASAPDDGDEKDLRENTQEVDASPAHEPAHGIVLLRITEASGVQLAAHQRAGTLIAR